MIMLNKYIINKNNNFLLITILISLLHLITINTGPINLEFTFSDAANYFISNDQYLLKQYFHYEANTLALPFAASIFSSKYYLFDGLLTIRFINIFCLFLLSYGVYHLCNYYNIIHKSEILLLILLNPLIWTFSERATSDFSPMALGVFSVALILNSKKYLTLLIGSIMLGFSILLKYHALIYLVIIYFLFKDKDKYQLFNYKKYSFVASISISFFILYNILVYTKFGFWLTPPEFQVKHGFLLSSFFSNLIAYSGFIFIATFPLFFCNLNYITYLKNNIRIITILLIILSILCFFYFTINGEVDFGPLNTIFNDRFRSFLFVIFGFFGFIFYFQSPKNNPFNLLKFSIFIILVLFSLTRPSQRYLILIIPFFILFLPQSSFSRRSLICFTLLLFFIINIYLECARLTTAKSSFDMVLKIQSLGLLDFTNPGVIEGHYGNYFNIYLREYKYTIISGYDKNAIITVSDNILFIRKTYSLIPFVKN